MASRLLQAKQINNPYQRDWNMWATASELYYGTNQEEKHERGGIGRLQRGDRRRSSIVSRLNQLDDVIFGHGISLLWWRSGGFKQPHDMPPSRFPPSPTFSDIKGENR
jgi:hypothetical protein